MNTTFLPVYRKAQSPEQTHFCPGCGHGNILKWVDEIICDLNIARRVIWVSPVGCGGLTDSYLSVSHVLAAHGRASAVATAIKRLYKDAIVIVSQGDGDLASIGLLEAIHAANRGENLTVLFINNANFGMTGGQMAPTSLIGQRTSTSPNGRTVADHGCPIKACELFSQLEGPAMIARVALGSVRQMTEARRIIQKAIENQVNQRGYSFVEILSPCPSNWHCTPRQARDKVASEMIQTFPTGIFRDTSRETWLQDRPCVSPYSPQIIAPAFHALAQPVETLPHPMIRISRPLSACCAGFGGQGVLTIGKILARIALYSGLNVTWIPSYGPEMRGGVANCFVRISPDRIDSPVVDTPDLVIALNQPSFDTFLPKLHPQGYIYYNCNCITAVQNDTRIKPIPATDLSLKCDSPKSANFILLGACLKQYIQHDAMPHLNNILGLILKPDQHAAFITGLEFSL